MAGETSAELTIVVRAQDAATRVIDGIGRTIGKVLLSPLKFVGNAVAGILKQFFSLKALLVGGGIIGVIRSVTDGLSTSQTKFREVFSAETQRGINAVDDAFGRLGASIRATFGNLVGDGSGGIAGFLDGISDWLRDNQDKIRAVFADIVDFFKTAALYMRAMANGRFSLGDMIFGNEEDVRRGLQRQREFEAALSRYEKQVKRVFGAGINVKDSNPIQALTGISEGRIDEEAKRATDAWSAFADATRGIETASEDARIDLLVKGMNAAAGAMENMAHEAKKAAEIVKVDVGPMIEELGVKTAKTAKEIREFNRAQQASVEIIEDYLTVGEAASLVSGSMTDAFQDIIQGTQSVGRAFASMVSTILGELGRLLVQRSLLNLLTSVGASLFGGPGSLSSANTSSSGALTPDFDFPQLARASGGPVRNSGIVRVGENGPENVVLPRGSHVMSSQRSRDGGGDTINVYGARDPKATAREVAYERRRSAGLRRALA